MDDVIKTLKKAKDVLRHVPGLSQVLSVALMIAQQTQDFKDTQDACLDLGRQALELTLRLCEHLRRHECDDPMRDHIQKFVNTLEGIKSVMNRRLRKGFVRQIRFWANTGSIAKKTRQLQRKLCAAAQLFEIKMSLDSANALHGLIKISNDLMEQLVLVTVELKVVKADIAEIKQKLLMPSGMTPWDDVPPDYIDQEALSLLPDIDIGEVSTPMAQEPVNHWRATLLTPSASRKGKVVAIRKQFRSDGGFVDTPTIAKAWHRYILFSFRYSPSEQIDKAYIVTEGYQTFEEYSKSLNGFEKLRGILSAMEALCEAANYLEEENLQHYILDRPTSRLWLNEERDIEQSELVFDLRSRHIKWKLERPPVAGGVIMERPDQTPLFGLPVWSSSRNQLLDQLRSGLGQNDLNMAEMWFLLLQTQTSILAIHRQATIWEPPNLESLVPVGTWLVQKQTSTSHTQSSPLKMGNFKMQLRHPPRFFNMYEEDRPEGTLLGTDDYPLVTIFRANVYPSDAYYAGYARATSRDEADIDLRFLTSDRTWNGSRFPNLPFGTTLSFPQHLRSNFTMMQALPSLTDAILDNETSIVTASTYIVETAMVRTAYANPQAPTPLWFFILKHDNVHDYPLSRDVPWGFWSTEESPTSIPPDIIFSPPHRARESAFPFAWTQVLGGRVFHIRARVALECMTLTQDEALVLKLCRSTSDSSAGKHQTTSKDEDENDNQQQQVPLSFQVTVFFFVVALFLVVAPSFFIILCLVIAPFYVLLL